MAAASKKFILEVIEKSAKRLQVLQPLTFPSQSAPLLRLSPSASPSPPNLPPPVFAWPAAPRPSNWTPFVRPTPGRASVSPADPQSSPWTHRTAVVPQNGVVRWGPRRAAAFPWLCAAHAPAFVLEPGPGPAARIPYAAGFPRPWRLARGRSGPGRVWQSTRLPRSPRTRRGAWRRAPRWGRAWTAPFARWLQAFGALRRSCCSYLAKTELLFKWKLVLMDKVLKDRRLRLSNGNWKSSYLLKGNSAITKRLVGDGHLFHMANRMNFVIFFSFEFDDRTNVWPLRKLKKNITCNFPGCLSWKKDLWVVLLERLDQKILKRCFLETW